jgi:hypothetical protein
MFDQLVKPPNKTPFAKVATILAVTAGVSFGLCTVGAFASSNGGAVAKVLTRIAVFCGGGLVVVCLVGLVILGIIMIIKQVVDMFRGEGKD